MAGELAKWFMFNYRHGSVPITGGLYNKDGRLVGETDCPVYTEIIIDSHLELPNCLGSQIGRLFVDERFHNSMNLLIGDYVFFHPIEIRDKGEAEVLDNFYLVLPKTKVSFEIERIPKSRLLGDEHIKVHDVPPDAPIVYESYGEWFVRGDFKKLFVENGFTGFEFTEIEIA